VERLLDPEGESESFLRIVVNFNRNTRLYSQEDRTCNYHGSENLRFIVEMPVSHLQQINVEVNSAYKTAA
jgi:hypothetical protein